jgi:phasin family protein
MSKLSSDADPFANLTKMFDQFKVPGLDMSSIIEARRKDLDALVAANKSAYESMQAVASKQTEILTHAMESLQASAKQWSAGSATTPDLAKQTELAREIYQKALGDMTALAEMVRNAQAEAMSGIMKRAAESLEEMKRLMQPK